MKNRICLILGISLVFVTPVHAVDLLPSTSPVIIDAPTASFGPQDAVIKFHFAKEKQLRIVVIGLYDDAAPQTVANFKKLIQKGFYNGLRCHRSLPHLLLQAGDPKSRWGTWSDTLGTGGPGYTIPPEIQLPHVAGAVAAARLPDNINPMRLSNGSQFYICLDSLPKLDGKYTVFGHVLEGLPNVDAMSEARTDSNDFPLDKIVIISITLQPHRASLRTSQL